MQNEKAYSAALIQIGLIQSVVAATLSTDKVGRSPSLDLQPCRNSGRVAGTATATGMKTAGMTAVARTLIVNMPSGRPKLGKNIPKKTGQESHGGPSELLAKLRGSRRKLVMVRLAVALRVMHQMMAKSSKGDEAKEEEKEGI